MIRLSGISERWRVAWASLGLVWLFFIEYLPPFRNTKFWSDIEGYHHPLLNYTHKSIRAGRLPEWDPTIYSGMPFAGNIQAAVFYPPNWILHLAHLGYDGIRFLSIEILAIFHVWLAFFFGYLWLRERSRHWIPAVLGGSVIAFGGYLLSQMNHLGVGCGYAWIPLGMWGIEQASRQQSWRPLWKLAIASAMCFLAGYPANWAAFALVAVAFAIASRGYLKLAMQSVSALVFSLLLSAVALLPSIEAARMKTPEQVFGGGLMEAPGIWLSYLLPNFYNQNRTGPGPEMLEGPYLYLGAAAIFALLWAIRHPWRKSLLPSVSIAAASFWFMTDPGEVLTRVMLATTPLAGDVIRQFNFLLGPAFAAALLTTDSLDNFLNVQTGWRVPNALRILWLVSAVAFSGLLVLIWQHLGVVAFTGLASAGYVLVLLALFGLGMAIFRSAPTTPVVLALLTMVFFEYKAFGTNRKFNAHTGNADRFYRGDARLGGRSLRGLDDEVYEQIKREPYYRVAIVAGFHATDFRHYSLTTPQGFDPFLPEPYKRAVEAYVPFQTNRLFAIDPLNLPFLDRFAVRFVMTQADTPEDRKLVEHQSFRLLEPSTSFFRIHELIGARPIWRFSGDVKPAHWSPERRTFQVDSRQGGAFTLVEQFFPGWHATVDGRENPLEVSDGAFQSTQVPAGKHEVAFVYRPLSLRIGAVLSLISTVILSLVAVKRL